MFLITIIKCELKSARHKGVQVNCCPGSDMIAGKKRLQRSLHLHNYFHFNEIHTLVRGSVSKHRNRLLFRFHIEVI